MSEAQEIQAILEQQQISQSGYKNSFESESFKFSELLLKDDMDKIPDELQKPFWVFFDKELSLSNLGEQDVQKIIFLLGLVKLDIMMSKPDYDLRFEDMANLDAMTIKAVIKAKRSTGGIERERALFVQQVKQFLTNEGSQVKGGFLSKIGSMFGGRKS
jgi:hypothetical protein